MYMQLLTAKPPFFTAADCSIESFATDLGTNRSYASRFVNQELGVTFSTLLNKLRLAHFMRLKSKPEKSSISSLAKRCGFSNAFSFRRAFKREYGKTPSEYLKEEIANEQKHAPHGL